jgi:hypothetical protein
MVRDGVTALEVKRSFYERYNRWIDKQMDGTAWVVSNNYYKSASGRIVTQWPFGPMAYGAMVKLFGPPSEFGRVLERRSRGPAPSAAAEHEPVGARRLRTGAAAG